MEKHIRILLIEDSEDDALLTIRHIEAAGYLVSWQQVQTHDELLASLRESWDIIISDYVIPGFSGIEALRTIRETGIDTPVIVVSGKIGEETAVETIKAGAGDYVMKSNLHRLASSIEREVAAAQSERDRKILEKALRASEIRYQNLVDSANVGIVVVQDGWLKYANPKVVEICGYSLGELQTKHVLAFVLRGDRKKVLEQHGMQLAQKAAPDASVVFRIADKFGKVRWIESSGVVIDWDDRPATLNYLLDITERRQAEIRLSEMVQELQIEQQMLEEKNIALREILSHIDAEKEAISRRIGSNLNHAILPTLIRLRNEANPATGRLLALLQRDIEEITSPFISTIKDRFTTLSPREVEICHLIKRGMSSKEIADMLSLSPMTIQKFRELIRKKLGLTNEDVNLNTYLDSMK